MTKKYKMPYFNEYVIPPLKFSLCLLPMCLFVIGDSIVKGEGINQIIDGVITILMLAFLAFVSTYLYLRIDLRYYIFKDGRLVCKDYFGSEREYINFNNVKEIGIREIPKENRNKKYSKLFPYVIYISTKVNPAFPKKTQIVDSRVEVDYLEIFYTVEKLQYIKEHYDKDIVNEEIVNNKNNSVSLTEGTFGVKTTDPIRKRVAYFIENDKRINNSKLVLPFLGSQYLKMIIVFMILSVLITPFIVTLLAIVFGVMKPFTLENILSSLYLMSVISVLFCFICTLAFITIEYNKVLDSYYVVTKDSITYKSFLGRTQNKIMFKDLIEVGIVKDSYNKFSEFYPYKIYFITNKEVYNDAVNNAIFERVYPGYIQVFCDFNKLKAIKRFYKGYIKDEQLIQPITLDEKKPRLKRKNTLKKDSTKKFTPITNSLTLTSEKKKTNKKTKIYYENGLNLKDNIIVLIILLFLFVFFLYGMIKRGFHFSILFLLIMPMYFIYFIVFNNKDSKNEYNIQISDKTIEIVDKRVTESKITKHYINNISSFSIVTLEYLLENVVEEVENIFNTDLDNDFYVDLQSGISSEFKYILTLIIKLQGNHIEYYFLDLYNLTTINNIRDSLLKAGIKEEILEDISLSDL